MNTDMLVWVAQQIGLKAIDNGDFVDVWRQAPKSNFGYIEDFDLTADTPQAAYDREKVVEWLGKEHGKFVVNDASHQWLVMGRSTCLGIGWFDTYEQAIIAACEYVWRKEVGDEPKT